MALDPETLERLRRGVPLRMDALGALWFGDEPVTHPRVKQAIRNGLDITEQGEYRMFLGDQWAYLTIEDCPLRATGIKTSERGELQLELDDGRVVALDPASVQQDDRGLRASAPSRHSDRRLPVRFTNTAQMDLSNHLQPEGDGFAVVVAGQRWPITTTDGS